jgi:hypothetical protein
MRKLTRVLEATMNGPSGTGSRRQASARPRLTMGLYDVTGGTTAIFHACTAARSGNWGFRGNALICRCKIMVQPLPGRKWRVQGHPGWLRLFRGG